MFACVAGLLAGLLIASPALADDFRPPVPEGSKVAGCTFDSTSCASSQHHAGEDWHGQTATAVADGIVEAVVTNGNGDHGLGNTVILRHQTTAGATYSLYAHLASIAGGVVPGGCIAGAQPIGSIGGTGYGQSNRWPVHLHLEVKDEPVLQNPSGGGPYWGYTPGSALSYGYHDPSTYYGALRAVLECGLKFDAGRVFSSNTLLVTQGDTVRAVVQARYYGLQELRCGNLNLGTKGDAPANFRADRAGLWPASQWRNTNRVAAFGCNGTAKPGSDVRWAPEFYVPATTPPGRYLAGEFHPVLDEPGGGHASLSLPITLQVIPRYSAPSARAVYKACLAKARSKKGKARRRARAQCRARYRATLLHRCLSKASKKRGKAKARTRRLCRKRYG